MYYSQESKSCFPFLRIILLLFPSINICAKPIRKILLLLLLLLNCFSHVRLCATPQTAAHQAPPSLGFSRQEHWSGLPFLLQCIKVKSESEVAQLRPSLSNPMDCSPLGSSAHGIFQARVLEWVNHIPLLSAKMWLVQQRN